MVIDGVPVEMEGLIRMYFNWDPLVSLGQYLGSWKGERSNTLPISRIDIHHDLEKGLSAHFWNHCGGNECDAGEARFFYSAYEEGTIQVEKDLRFGTGNAWKFILQPDGRLKVLPVQLSTDDAINPSTRGEPQFFTQEFSLERATVLAYEGRYLNANQAELAEENLKQFPENLAARTLLLGFYYWQVEKQVDLQPVIAARQRHILWLIEHAPESEITRINEALIAPRHSPLADAAGFKQAEQLWRQKLKANKCDFCVYVHSYLFVQLHDKPLAEEILRGYYRGKPADPHFQENLSRLYAYGILGLTGLTINAFPEATDPSDAQSPFARKAKAFLLHTHQVPIIENAAAVLVDFGIRMREKDATGDFTVDFESFSRQLIQRGERLSPERAAWNRLRRQLERYYGKLSLSSDYLPQLKKVLEGQEAALQKMGTVPYRISYLSGCALMALQVGELDKAQEYAQEGLDLTRGQDIVSSIYRAKMKMILGRVALRRGDMDSARSFLIQAGNEPIGQWLERMFPSMALAKELLEHGERAAVLEYLKICADHWNKGKEALLRWRESIEQGQAPKFSYATLVE